MVTIVKVRSDTDVNDVKILINEFIDWLSERYPELEDTIAAYFKQQGFEEEMNNLLSVFGPPHGECLLARIADQPVGIVMMKEHGSTACEMNRMFVRNSARRQGVAQALVDQLFINARKMGYKRMILSALDKHYESLPLYRKMGFEDDDRPADSGDDEHEVRMVCIL
jgi:GNAT superfamily N-acetyltransferase